MCNTQQRIWFLWLNNIEYIYYRLSTRKLIKKAALIPLLIVQQLEAMYVVWASRLFSTLSCTIFVLFFVCVHLRVARHTAAQRSGYPFEFEIKPNQTESGQAKWNWRILWLLARLPDWLTNWLADWLPDWVRDWRRESRAEWLTEMDR